MISLCCTKQKISCSIAVSIKYLKYFRISTLIKREYCHLQNDPLSHNLLSTTKGETGCVFLFIASFGGIFSLFLGCSFISGAEILYYLFIRFAIYLKDVNRIKPKKTERLQRSEVLLKSKNFPRIQQVYHGQPDAEIAIYSIYRRDTFVNQNQRWFEFI